MGWINDTAPSQKVAGYRGGTGREAFSAAFPCRGVKLTTFGRGPVMTSCVVHP